MFFLYKISTCILCGVLCARSFRRTCAQITQTAKLSVMTPNLLELKLSVLRTATNYHIAGRITGLKEHPTQSKLAISALHLLGILSMVLESI